jgi:hypothetical protein
VFFIYISNAIPFASLPSKKPLSPPPPPAPQPTHSHSWSWHSPILGHRAFTGPRASPPIDDWLGHPLIHIQLEPQVPPCVFFDGGIVPRSFWGYWLVHIDVPPMGLQTPSAPWPTSFLMGEQDQAVVTTDPANLHPSFPVCSLKSWNILRTTFVH